MDFFCWNKRNRQQEKNTPHNRSQKELFIPIKTLFEVRTFFRSSCKQSPNVYLYIDGKIKQKIEKINYKMSSYKICLQ